MRFSLLLLSAACALTSATHSPSGFIKQRRSHALAGRALGDLVGAVDSAAAAATAVVGGAVADLSGVGRQLEGNLSSIVIVKAAVEAATTSAGATTTASRVSSTVEETDLVETSSSAPATSLPLTTSVVASTSALASTSEAITAPTTSATSLAESTVSTSLPTATLTSSLITSTTTSLPASLRTVTAASRSTTSTTTSPTSTPSSAILSTESQTKPSATKITFVTLGIIGGAILALLIGFTLLRKFVWAKKSDKFDDRLVPPTLWPNAEGGGERRQSWESFGSRRMSAVMAGASFGPPSSVSGRNAGANVGSSVGSFRSQVERGYGSIRREGGDAAGLAGRGTAAGERPLYDYGAQAAYRV